MAIGPDAEARSFVETRRTLLDALDRTEQAAHDQAAELVSVAEQRAREITIKADQSAALIEEQLAYLTAQLDHVRARVTDIRTRLRDELQAQADRPSSISQPEPVQGQAVPVTSPVSAAVSAAPDVPLRSQEIVVDTDDSLPETLRVLRAALASLNGDTANV